MGTSIEITDLPEAVLADLQKRAQTIGATPPDYVRYLIEDDLASPISPRVLYAPVREQIRASGTSNDELDRLLETNLVANGDPPLKPRVKP